MAREVLDGIQWPKAVSRIQAFQRAKYVGFAAFVSAQQSRDALDVNISAVADRTVIQDAKGLKLHTPPSSGVILVEPKRARLNVYIEFTM